MQIAKQLINGQWLDAINGKARIGEALNPATGEIAAHFADGGAVEAQAAVAAALKAFETTAWKRSPRLRAAACR